MSHIPPSLPLLYRDDGNPVVELGVLRYSPASRPAKWSLETSIAVLRGGDSRQVWRQPDISHLALTDPSHSLVQAQDGSPSSNLKLVRKTLRLGLVKYWSLRSPGSPNIVEHHYITL